MSDNFFTSEGQLEVGNEGERVVFNFLKSKWNVVSLNDEKYTHLRKYDIDYVFSGNCKIDEDVLLKGDINEINEKYVSVELKTDTRICKTGNMFFEEKLIRERDGLEIKGYMNKCKAKLFLYYDNVNNKLYGGLFSELKKFYDNNKNNMKLVKLTSEIVGTKDKCVVIGYLYNIDTAIKNKLMRKFTSF